MGAFNTQEEIRQVIEFACQKFQVEVEAEDKQLKQREEQKKKYQSD
jgi:hypothetical protein